MGESPGRGGTHRTSILANAGTVRFYPGDFAQTLTTFLHCSPLLSCPPLFGPFTALTWQTQEPWRPWCEQPLTASL